MTNTKPLPFKDLLKYIREQKGFTQDDLAAKLDVSKGAVSQWETGRTLPTFFKLQELERILGHKFIIEEEYPQQNGNQQKPASPDNAMIMEILEEMRRENKTTLDTYLITASENVKYRVLIKNLKNTIMEMDLAPSKKSKLMNIINDFD